MKLLFGLGVTTRWRSKQAWPKAKKRRRKTRRRPPDSQLDPVLFPCRPTATPPGEDKVAILAARYAKGQSLWSQQDRGVPEITKPMVLRAFADMFLAHCIHGVEKRHDSSWRANPWSGVHNRHIHLGYFRRQEEAIAAVAKWKNQLAGEEDLQERRDAWAAPEEEYL